MTPRWVWYHREERGKKSESNSKTFTFPFPPVRPVICSQKPESSHPHAVWWEKGPFASAMLGEARIKNQLAQVGRSQRGKNHVVGRRSRYINYSKQESGFRFTACSASA